MTEVWALNLLPVVRERKPGRPGRDDTWSEEQLELLVKLRERPKNPMRWSEISHRLNRPISSCHGRYKAIVAARAPKEEPKPRALSAAAPRRPRRLHEELGIKTYRVSTTMIDASGRIYVKAVTLSAGHIQKPSPACE